MGRCTENPAVEKSSLAARLWITVVELALVAVGMRDRLRCPRCRAVGTWKPHGSMITERRGRPVARWLCKWCGFYRGPEVGVERATMRMATRTWEIDLEADEVHDTPKKRLLDDAKARGEDGAPDPWNG